MSDLVKLSKPPLAMETRGGAGVSSSLGIPRTGTAENLKGPTFQETLNQIDKGGLGKTISGLNAEAGPENKEKAVSKIKFSNHAIERMQTRGVSFSPEDLKKLETAVGKAANKGAKDSLVLMNDTALIVSVKNNTVVTVVDKNSLKENVFTNIDSTVVV